MASKNNQRRYANHWQKKTGKIEKKQDIQDADKRKAVLECAAKAANKMERLLIKNLQGRESNVYNTYNKQRYRDMMRGLSNKNNQASLRDMSKFLERVSNPYRRIMLYYSTISLYRWNITPVLDEKVIMATVDDEEKKKMLAEYLRISRYIERLNLETSLKKMVYTYIRDGVFYGIVVEGEESIFIYPLDAKYCEIVEIENGIPKFGFNLDYFKNKQYLLDNWDIKFKKAWNKYQNGKSDKWYIMDVRESICIPPLDYDFPIPFFTGIFESLIDLIDARALQKNRDIIENYKLIVQKIPMNTSDPDFVNEYELYLDTLITYHNALLANVPDNMGVAMSPMDIDTIDFTNKDNDADLISNAMRGVFSDSGVSEMLFNGGKTTEAGITASIQTDTSLARMIVQQIEAWLKVFISYQYKDYKFNFEILDVNIFNKDVAVANEIKLANNGLPNKMKLAALAGISPAQTLSTQLFENDILQVVENWMPLQTSYTMGNDNNVVKGIDTDGVDGGRPKIEAE